MADLELIQFSSRGLAPFDLRIAGGECVTISGASGAGKTLLLRAIADLDPHDGEARVAGTKQSSCPPAEWRRRVGLLPAETHWWADRVGTHFRTAEPPRLRELGLAPDAMEWEVHRLSSGERQRLGLARMLELEPEVLLLDEPTANLDESSSARVEELIEEYRRSRGAAVLWVGHSAEQRRRVAERGFVINAAGELLEERWT
jgi:ABC-type iron transport system FetAB ATPase subunit